MDSPLWVEEMDSYPRADGLKHFARRAFCRDYFLYKPGQHVVFGGASQHGKTTMAMDLIEYIVTPDFPAYLAQSKPRDPVTERRGRELGFRTVSEWPPSTKLKEMAMFGGQKPSGYIVKIQFGNLRTDMQRSAQVTSDLIMERYASGASRKNEGGILLMDDTMVKAKIQGLDNQMVTILAMAGAMDLGLWTFVQKPTDSGRTTLWAYENSDLMFLTSGGDEKMLKRYGEIIGGNNGKIAIQTIPTLKPYEFLFVDKAKNHMCVVGAS